MEPNKDERPDGFYYPAWLDKVSPLSSATEEQNPLPILNAPSIDVVRYQSRDLLPDNFYKVISTIL